MNPCEPILSGGCDISGAVRCGGDIRGCMRLCTVVRSLCASAAPGPPHFRHNTPLRLPLDIGHARGEALEERMHIVLVLLCQRCSGRCPHAWYSRHDFRRLAAIRGSSSHGGVDEGRLQSEQLLQAYQGI
jgi:hypothetical protein